MLQSKFEIGQKVFCVRVSWLSEKTPCPDCLSTTEWTVTLPTGETFQTPCNTCSKGYFSSGYVYEYADRVHIEPLTIGSIRMDTKDEDPFTYMCVETGVGSGNVYYEKDMFADLASAEAFGSQELDRVKGLRMKQELEERSRKKKNPIYMKSKK